MEITQEDTFEAVIRLVGMGHKPVALPVAPILGRMEIATARNPGRKSLQKK